MRRAVWSLLTAAGLVGCGGGTKPPAPPPVGPGQQMKPSTASATKYQNVRQAGLVQEDNFGVGSHEPLPQVPDDGGHVVLDHVQMISITYDSYEYRDMVESLDHWIVGSDWYKTVGTDYGVKNGTHVMDVHLSQPAPSSITDFDIEDLLSSLMKNGAMPKPGDQLPDGSLLTEPLYTIYFPSTTVITEGNSQSCMSFGGYHSWVAESGATPRFSYAVLPTCGKDTQELEVALSHELAEAATDPFPDVDPNATVETGTFSIQDYTKSPWAFVPGEVGDLCTSEYLTEGPFTVQKIWSNSAAAAGVDPCIPSTDPVYFNSSASPAETQIVNPGDTVTFTVQGWSTGPMRPWSLDVRPSLSSFAGGGIAQLDSKRMGNGGATTLTLNIPSYLQSGDYASFMLVSTSDDGRSHYWPIAIIVQ